jgi:galactokinase
LAADEQYHFGSAGLKKSNEVMDALKSSKFKSWLSEQYGPGRKTVETQVERYSGLINGFISTYSDNKPVELFASPGRVEVGGNHTDHNAGRVLAAAVDVDIIAAVSKNESGLVRVRSEGFEEFSADIRDLSVSKDEQFTPLALVKGVLARMNELGYSTGGFDLYCASTIPIGAGLSSSAAFEVLIVTIMNQLYNGGKISSVQSAQIAQYSENVFFGKPCGLMDQTTCAVGGFVTIDFKDFSKPLIKKIDFDFSSVGYTMVIVDTGGHHADLNDDYTAIENEMKDTAREMGGSVLREFSVEDVIKGVPSMRKKISDRALLRAYHFYRDDQRVVGQVKALERNDFDTFLQLITDSGYSSWMYCQNCYTSKDVEEQGLSVALMVSEYLLSGRGAWRVHGGGFAGTIQAFVPVDLVLLYTAEMMKIFGPESCYPLIVRPSGAQKIELW